MASGPENFTKGGPEAESAIPDGQFWWRLQPTLFEIEQQLAPALGTFAVPILKAYQLLVAIRSHADQHKDALLFVLHPGFEVHSISPDIDIGLVQLTIFPGLHIRAPIGDEAPDCLGRKVRSVRTQQSRQCIHHLAG